MNDPALQAQIDSATAYQEFFVPALFQAWAPRVVAAARIQPRDRVLDVACSTGVLAREAASRLGSTGSVAGLDPNPGMLAVAGRLAPALEWRRGTAESLPYADQSFDVVVSQCGLMFFTDRRQALREMLRGLAPGGRLVIAVWDWLDNTPAYAAEVALLARIAGRRAADALRAPFVLGDGWHGHESGSTRRASLNGQHVASHQKVRDGGHRRDFAGPDLVLQAKMLQAGSARQDLDPDPLQVLKGSDDGGIGGQEFHPRIPADDLVGA
jgi:SAM-dependent methyltransferase